MKIEPGGAPVVMLSYGYWQKHFAGRPDVIGQSLTLDGKPHTVIGVLPKDATTFPLNQITMFTTRPYEAPFLTPQQIDNGGIFYTALARLKPGVGIDQARAAMDVIASGYAQGAADQCRLQLEDHGRFSARRPGRQPARAPTGCCSPRSLRYC